MTSAEKVRLIEAHAPRWESAWMWLGFLVAFFLADGLLAWSVLYTPVWLTVVLVLLAGHLMHSHLTAFHEAAHETLCPNPWVNDLLGVIIGQLSFMSLSLYRAAHHYHHAYLATERDEELWPFVIPGTPRWWRCFLAFAELTMGLVYTPLLFLRTFLRKRSPIQDPRVRRRIWIEFGLMTIVWSAVFFATAWWGVWKFFVVLYLLPAILAGNMQSFRKYIEHMGLTGSSVLSSTRSIAPPGLIGRFIAFTLFNVSYHGVHHQYAKMPQPELPRFPEALVPLSEEEVPPYRSYVRAWLDMMKSLGDPKVGVQWLTKEASRPPVHIGRGRHPKSAGGRTKLQIANG